ncbi:hypothetical protein CEXT_324251 [Caerostris extrusa]|uniref:Uncharacterized protein n=1 Tax=Caerostris extrusa TaxID=172846 RepID=A0AAV4Y4E9_CAEEX|nr:hypothetical protein CEXT_324251 [Caerostris extrusa]
MGNQFIKEEKSPSRTSDSEISIGTNSLSHSSHQSEPFLMENLPFNYLLNSTDAQNSDQIVSNGEEKVATTVQKTS